MSHSVFPKLPLEEMTRDAALPGEENIDKRIRANYAALYNETDEFFVDLLCKSFDADDNFKSRDWVYNLYELFMQVSGSAYGAKLIIYKFEEVQKTDKRYIEIIESLVDLSSRIEKIDASLFYHSKIEYL
ncbi:MAG: hypothetical protein ABJN14_00895 [Paracoccaceae bacterium]